MAVLEISTRQREMPNEAVSYPSRRIGGVREFSISAVLMLCFAICVAVVVKSNHREIRGVVTKAATAVQRVPIASPGISFRSEDNPAAAGAAHDLVSSAQNGVYAALDLVWGSALWMSDRIVSYVSNTWVNPVSGDRLFFDAAPGASSLAVSVIAFAMVALVVFALAGPLYASWKSWRLSRAHVFRYR